MCPGVGAGGAEPASGEPGAVLDDDIVGGLRALGSGLLGDVVDLWAAQLPVALDQIRTAAASGDTAALAAAAHGLRGSSANVGARRLAEACAVVEEAARGGTGVADLGGLSGSIGTEAEAARLALAESVRLAGLENEDA
jgi:HPt (histidine-containing phosphotransfer) domain-containing protein